MWSSSRVHRPGDMCVTQFMRKALKYMRVALIVGLPPGGARHDAPRRHSYINRTLAMDNSRFEGQVAMVNAAPRRVHN